MRVGRTASVIAALVALGLLLSAVGAGLLFAADSGSTSSADDVELSEDARELVRLLERGATASFHARYDATVDGVTGNAVTIETWRDDGKIRQDMVVSSGEQEVRTATIDVDGSRTVCTQLGEDAWNCRSEVPGGDPLVGAVRERLARGKVSARTDEVDGKKVRCFTVESPGGDTNELCATSAGVPVLVSAGRSELRLLSLDSDIDPNVFQPPA